MVYRNLEGTAWHRRWHLRTALNKAVVGSRLCPRVLYLPIFIVEQNLDRMDALIAAVMSSRRLGIHTTHRTIHCVKMWRHPQNRKAYITYRNAASGGPSQCRNRHDQKFGEVRPNGFRDMRADQTHSLQTHRRAHQNISQYVGSKVKRNTLENILHKRNDQKYAFSSWLCLVYVTGRDLKYCVLRQLNYSQCNIIY